MDEDGFKIVKNKFSGENFHEKAISTVVSLHYQANSKLLAGFMEAVEKVLIKWLFQLLILYMKKI